MITKTFEVRDRATFVPVLAVQMVPWDERTVERRGGYTHEVERYLLRRCGYPTEPPYSVLLCRLDGSGRVAVDPYDWADRTFTTAHDYIEKNFDSLEDGAVADVEFILGETQAPKASERETSPL